MPGRISVADLVARTLERFGVQCAFGVISVHNIALLDAIARRNAIRFVMARGETGAAHMADGYARGTGALGVVFSSTGPGAASAVPGLFEALAASTPLLHITGQIPLGRIGREQGVVHDVRDQFDMLRAVSKSVFRVYAPETIVATLTKAVATALAPPCGPVSIEIPIDVQQSTLDDSVDPPALSPAVVPAFASPAPAEMEALTARVTAARRPLLWLGSGAREAAVPASRLVEKGFGVVSSWNGRGIVPEDSPGSLGAFGGAISPEVEAFYETVDLMIVAGSRLRGQHTREMRLKLPANLVQIDVDPLANGRTYASRLFIAADAAATLGALADALPHTLAVDPAFGTDLADTRRAARARLESGLGAYAGFADQLRAALPRSGIFARDITLSNSTWAQYSFAVYRPRDTLYPVGGGIGTGLCLGLGAAFGSGGRKTVILCGDGGFFVNTAELATAVQERLDIVVVVMNDAGYGIIRHIQSASYGGREFFVDLQNPGLAALAAATGMGFRRVTDAARFGPEIAAALDDGGPVLVEVDMRAIGPFPMPPTLTKRV